MADSTKKASVNKANFDEIYVCPDPRPFFSALYPLDYQVPQHAVAVTRDELARLGKVGGTVLDVCCSFGINAALQRTDLSIADLGRYCADPQRQHLDSEVVREQDTRFFAARQRAGAPRFKGVDASAPAIAYATSTGLLAQGWAENLETDEASDSLAAGIADVDLVMCTGGIGYVGAATFARIAEAHPAPERLVFVSFALRAYDFNPIARALESYGLATVQRPELTVRQRRFIDSNEQSSAVDSVRARGLSTAGREDEGWYYADCFVSAAPH